MPAPADAVTFANLEDLLLRGGIAPRHARRYLRELGEHLADLTQAQREAGYDEADAGSRARAALGLDKELADAMLKQRDFRSISARFPWLVFGITPVFLCFALNMVIALAIVGIAVVGRVFGQPQGAPFWFRLICHAGAFAATFLAPLLAAALLVILAVRQRMSLLWPLLAIAAMVIFGTHMQASFPAPGHPGASIGLAPTLLRPPRMIGGANFHVQWMLAAAQAAIALLPAAWLLARQYSRKAA